MMCWSDHPNPRETGHHHHPHQDLCAEIQSLQNVVGKYGLMQSILGSYNTHITCKFNDMYSFHCLSFKGNNGIFTPRACTGVK